MPLPPEKSSRRKHHAADVPNGTGGGSGFGRGFLSVRTVFCGVAVVFIICSFQLVLLFSHTDPAYESQSQNARLWHYLQVHEANLTALALQQRELTRLLGQLNNLLVGQQKELRQVEDQLSNPPTPPSATMPAGGADSAVMRKMRELKVQHQEELDRQFREIAQLQAAVKSLSGDTATAPPATPASAAMQKRVESTPPEMSAKPAPALIEPGPELTRSPSDNGEWPEQWLRRFTASDLEASAKEAEQWRVMARNAAIHAWKGYRDRAWGKDELKPVSGAAGRIWGNTGLQILDALSTLWVMDLKEQFDEAADWVTQSLKFDHPAPVSFFEITIRALGGLLSAHALSGRPIFLQKARELGDKLLHAFNSQTGFPFTQLTLRTGEGKKGWYSGVVLAEAGTVQLEFRYLSQQLNDPKYAAAGDRAMRQILQAENGQGLVPWGLASSSPPRFTNSHITFGAMGDSYYEYLLKMYLQTDRSEPEWKNAWRRPWTR
ncbi:MNS1 [Symbiodinium natans]|uniref:alpha-1,2-Mannosidase n=1 Tax=Symbiodinium natans TaxID=878477 RepID=A0A812MAA3_9DINO|nr:MNS1 [Symbiodinium natans]